jgi:hypothetical protein
MLQMAGAHVIAQALHAIAELNVADHLADGPRSADDIASATGAHASSMHRILRTLTAFGVFDQDTAGRFSLTPLGATLRSNAPTKTRSAVRMLASPLMWGATGEFLHSARTGDSGAGKAFGKPIFECLAGDAQASTIFNEAMIGFHGDEPPAVAAGYDFSGIRTLVDVGGGTGNLLATILLAHPHLRGTLFDQPHVAPEARQAIQARGLADRCEVIEGSFFDPLPAGRDAYLLSHVIHDWDEASCLKILARVHDAMPANGRLLIVEQVIPDGNAFHPGKYLDMVMLVITGGRERTGSEYGDLLGKAGLTLTRVVPTASAVSVVEAQKR